jgi:hypothetical protein
VLRRGAVPGNSGIRLTNNTYTAWGNGVPGKVQTTFSQDGLSVTNVTLPAHMLVGSITRTIYTSGGVTRIRTVGTGSVGAGWINNIRDIVNEQFGPGIINDLDSETHEFAKRLVEGC